MAARKNPLFPVPADLSEVNTLLYKIGECERELADIKNSLETAVAKAKTAAELSAAPIEQTLKQSMKALQTYADANRKTLLMTGGEFGWRLPPTKIVFAKGGAEQVIKNLEAMELKQYLRYITEVDREALLRDRPAVSGVKYSQKEGFFVKTESSKAAESFPGIAKKA